MRVSRVVTLGVMAALFAMPVWGQIPPGGHIGPTRTLPRLMVANPYAFASTDSAAAVEIGSGMRDRMESAARGDFQVLTRKTMNEALEKYGYPDDAILQPLVQRRFAIELTARMLVTSTLARNDGLHTVNARLVGISDDAGTVVNVAQQQGKSLEDLGKQIADELKPAVKSSDDAHQCINVMRQDPKKAANAARKAIHDNPKSGLAWMCLVYLAQTDSASNSHSISNDSMVVLLKHATESDPLSLRAWTMLAEEYRQSGDTAGTVHAYQQMLIAAPTNQPLREQALKYFLAVGRTDAARQVAEEAIKLDPYNPDFYDLLSNVCVFENNYRCAVDALEKVFEIDTTKADSLFYLKISVMASNPSDNPDTTRWIHWARRGVDKYPNNIDLLQQLISAYQAAGQLDSMVSTTEHLLQVDSTQVGAALAAIKTLADTAAGSDSMPTRVADAMPLVRYVNQHGTPDQKQSTAVLLTNGALPLIQHQPLDTLLLQQAAAAMRMAVRMSDSTSRVYPTANYLLGLATFFQVPGIDPAAEKQKSCDLAHRERDLLAEAQQAFTLGRSVQPANIDKLLGNVDQYLKRADSMIKVYCK